MRTLSKAHGLAGARCGTLIANPEIIALLRKVIQPYAITQMTVEVGAETAGAGADRRRCRRTELAESSERERMKQAIAKLPGVKRLWPSDELHPRGVRRSGPRAEKLGAPRIC